MNFGKNSIFDTVKVTFPYFFSFVAIMIQFYFMDFFFKNLGYSGCNVDYNNCTSVEASVFYIIIILTVTAVSYAIRKQNMDSYQYSAKNDATFFRKIIDRFNGFVSFWVYDFSIFGWGVIILLLTNISIELSGIALVAWWLVVPILVGSIYQWFLIGMVSDPDPAGYKGTAKKKKKEFDIEELLKE